VQFEAQEIVNRCGWGLPLIEALRKVHDPYWREAVARYLMELWQNLVRDKDEQTYYYDTDGDVLPRAFTSKICELINAGKKDPEIYDNLRAYFPELNTQNSH